MTTKVHVYQDGTKLRRGGSTRGPSNLIKNIDSGHYEALYQCAGEYVEENGHTNWWWVKIKAGSDEGWVSAVLISEGGENQPIPGVDERATVFV